MSKGEAVPATPAAESGQPDLDDPRWRKLETVIRQLFSVNDFHQSDMRSIAREAGMGFGTIYKYFGDKEGLLFSFVDHWQHAMERHMIDAMDGAAGPEDTVRRMIRARLQYYDDNPDVARILFMTLPMKTWMEDPSFSERDLVQTELSVIHAAQAAGVLRADLPASALLDMMMGMLHRAVVMNAWRESPNGLAGQADALIDLFFRGCRG